MADFPFPAVGFDLDGTLLETHIDLGHAVNHALAAGGFAQIAVDSAKDLIGGGARAMLAQAIAQQGGLPEEQFHPLYQQMLEFYGAHASVHSRPFPGMERALDTLAARGVALAVVTNKFESFARSILTDLGLADRFVTIIGGDSLGKGKAKPAADPILAAMAACGVAGDPARFAYVGDSSYDVGAARAAAVKVVVAGYGYNDRPAAELGGDAVIAGFDALVGALERL